MSTDNHRSDIRLSANFFECQDAMTTTYFEHCQLLQDEEKDNVTKLIPLDGELLEDIILRDTWVGALVGFFTS